MSSEVYLVHVSYTWTHFNNSYSEPLLLLVQVDSSIYRPYQFHNGMCTNTSTTLSRRTHYVLFMLSRIMIIVILGIKTYSCA